MPTTVTNRSSGQLKLHLPTPRTQRLQEEPSPSSAAAHRAWFETSGPVGIARRPRDHRKTADAAPGHEHGESGTGKGWCRSGARGKRPARAAHLRQRRRVPEPEESSSSGTSRAPSRGGDEPGGAVRGRRRRHALPRLDHRDPAFGAVKLRVIQTRDPARGRPRASKLYVRYRRFHSELPRRCPIARCARHFTVSMSFPFPFLPFGRDGVHLPPLATRPQDAVEIGKEVKSVIRDTRPSSSVTTGPATSAS